MDISGLFVPFNPDGRPPKYTPIELLQKFEEYLKDRAERPLVKLKEKSGFTGGNPTDTTEQEEWPHPISLKDFCNYCGCGESWFRHLSDEFSPVTTRIRDYIEDFQFKGAAVGFFNSSIVARQLGLADKVEADVSKTTHIEFVQVNETKD